MSEVLITIPTTSATSSHQLRVSVEPAADSVIEQRYASVTPLPYLVVGGTAQAYPLLAAASATSAHVGPAAT